MTSESEGMSDYVITQSYYVCWRREREMGRKRHGGQSYRVNLVDNHTGSTWWTSYMVNLVDIIQGQPGGHHTGSTWWTIIQGQPGGHHTGSTWWTIIQGQPGGQSYRVNLVDIIQGQPGGHHTGSTWWTSYRVRVVHNVPLLKV
ncbi:hypothetical protein BgiBS90_017128 [Biomphalaria glabrata]|nr:hypothetical protein BgiBS90_017128 [Biomphalaria glabrata]